MSRDVYTAMSGAQATWKELEILANNVANVNTTGYRAGRVAFSVTGEGEGPLGQTTTTLDGVALSRSQGSLKASNDPSHMAINGEGFFTVAAGDETLLTRDGRFAVDNSGRLVDQSGNAVLGEGGPIQLEVGESFAVSKDGVIVGSTSGEVGRLRVALADEVTPAGGNHYRAIGELRNAVDYGVVQGQLEGSNTDPMRSMVELVEASRYFEACQKAIQASDELDQRANRSGGR
ncbi:MAG TPA: flagellar hook basal-body protein [Myxococcota bacterium]|nr:flagellar hook basal-body protein [Myxococcota bacterium]